MRTLARNFVFLCGGWILAGFFVVVFSARAQVSSQLSLQAIQLPGSGPVNFMFVDQGTGATNYSVESSAALNGVWLTVTNALITPQGGGTNLVHIAEPAGPKNFYRVVGFGASGGPIIISSPPPDSPPRKVTTCC